MKLFENYRKRREEKRKAERKEFLKHWYNDVYFLISVTPCFSEVPYRKIQEGNSYILAKGDKLLYRVEPEKRQAWPMIAEQDIYFEDQIELYKLLKVAFNTNKSLWDMSYEDFPTCIQSSKTQRAYLVYSGNEENNNQNIAIPTWFESDMSTAEELENLEENELLYNNDKEDKEDMTL